MKVYSWKNLLLTIFAGGAGVAYSCFKTYKDGLGGIPWLIMWGILIVQGLKASLTEKGFREDVQNEKDGKLAYRKLFGKFAPIMQFGPLICFAFGGALLWIFPTHIWIGMCFVIAYPFLQYWLYKAVRREIEREKNKQ